MAYDRFADLHDALTASSAPATWGAATLNGPESQWSAWGDLQPIDGAGRGPSASATARALQQAEAKLRDATERANQAALAAALDTTILKQALAAWEAAHQRAETCSQRVSRARRAYELKCAQPGPASTEALVALTAFRQACSEAGTAGCTATRALEHVNRATTAATRSSERARRIAAIEIAATAARNHALTAERAAHDEPDHTGARTASRLRPLDSFARLPERPSLALEVARSQGFCRSLASRLRPAA